MLLVDTGILEPAFNNPAILGSANVPVCRERRGCEAPCLLSASGPLEGIRHCWCLVRPSCSKEKCLRCFEIRSQKCMGQGDSMGGCPAGPGLLPWGRAPSLQPLFPLEKPRCVPQEPPSLFKSC